MPQLSLSRTCLLLVTLAGASPWASADIAVVVANDNSNDKLNAQQVADIFLSHSATFPDGTTVVPLDNASSLRARFYLQTTHKTAAQLRTYWVQQVTSGAGQPPKALDSDAEVLAVVSKNPNTVSYVDRAHVDASVKVLLTLP